MAAILAIGVPEALPQERLLEQRNVDRIDAEKGERPEKVRTRHQDGGLTEQDQDDTRNHRIPHMPIRSPHDEPPRGIPRRESTFALRREAPKTRREQDQTQSEGSDADRLQADARGGVCETAPDTVPPGEPQGHQHRDGEGQHRDRDEMPDQEDEICPR